jgi:hypothetical protein
MPNRSLDRSGKPSLTPVTPGRRHRFVVIALGALAVMLVTTGVIVARAGGPPAAAAVRRPSATVVKPSTVATTPTTPQQSPSAQPAGPSTTSPALGDGIYPAYIRGVNVPGAAITIDVVQVFENEAAATAAVEDGQSPGEAQYLYVYVRNESSRLRTLPVASDARIHFVGACESPPDQHAALEELAKKTTPFTDAYYYSVEVNDGVIRDITQHLAISAC